MVHIIEYLRALYASDDSEGTERMNGRADRL